MPSNRMNWAKVPRGAPEPFIDDEGRKMLRLPGGIVIPNVRGEAAKQLTDRAKRQANKMNARSGKKAPPKMFWNINRPPYWGIGSIFKGYIHEFPACTKCHEAMKVMDTLTPAQVLEQENHWTGYILANAAERGWIDLITKPKTLIRIAWQTGRVTKEAAIRELLRQACKEAQKRQKVWMDTTSDKRLPNGNIGVSCKSRKGGNKS